jgi:glycosyltransferase involved in cell wall biosynthesis
MFLAVSPAVARLNGLPHADVPFDIIPNFVPDDIAEVSADADHPELASLPEQYILFVGDLCSMKGVNILLEAYRRLPAPPPLVLIGRRLPDTPTAVPPNVFIFEKWPHAAVLHAWKRCLFGVAPSILNEACATVVMEAMAFGKPMVVTGVGGMPELVEHGKTGLIVEPHAASLQGALALLLADAALRARMGAASLGKSETLKATVVASRIEDAYRSLLARPRVRTRRQFGTGATAPFRR